MIIIQFQGGLGNQISQYAFYKKMCDQYKDVPVKADLSFYDLNDCHQGFELFNIFKNVTIPLASKKEIIFCSKQIPITSNKKNSLLKLINMLARKGTKLIKKNTIIYQKIESGYPEETKFKELNPKKNYYLSGYWHSYDYSDIMRQIRLDLTFPCLQGYNAQIKEAIDSCNSVSIHVRRGDYVDSMYDIIDDDYYTTAISIIEEKVEKPVYYIFSDDKDYAAKLMKQLLNNKKYYILSGNTGKDSYIDMQLMSCCKHNIIANSTFSYWAAQLNSNPHKIVIRPKMQTRNRKTWNVPNWHII